MNVFALPRPFSDETLGPAQFLTEMAKIDASVIWDTLNGELAISFGAPIQHQARLQFLLPFGGSPLLRSAEWNCRFIALIADILSLSDDLSICQRKEKPLRERLLIEGGCA